MKTSVEACSTEEIEPAAVDVLGATDVAAKLAAQLAVGAQGSLALPRCTAPPTRHTGFANAFGASVAEAAARPNPRWRPRAAAGWRLRS